MEEHVFTGYLTNIYQNGCVMLAISLGQDLGLFKLMCESSQPLSLKDIADKLDLKERYTLELLSTMVAADIVHQDKDTRLYTLPDGHKTPLMSNGGGSPIIVMLAKRVDAIKKCCKKNGPYGISYAESPEWFDWFNGYRSSMRDHTVNSEIIPLWKNQPGLIQKLEMGIRMLDVGCGPGNYTNVLAQKFSNSTFTGLDNSKAGIGMANASRVEKGLENITFIEGDAHNLPEDWTNSFDMVFVYDTLHDLPNPHKALGEIYKVLKDDGTFSLTEFGFHSDPVDNAGNMNAAMHYSSSIFVCLASSMTEEPHIGYGACWGVEEIEKALKAQKFKVEGKATIQGIGTKAFLHCTKRA